MSGTTYRPVGWIPLGHRRVLDARGHVSETEEVFCPFQGRTFALSDCRTCEFLDGVCADAVLCQRDWSETWPIGTAGEQTPSTAYDLRTPIGAIMTRDVTCVREGVALTDVLALFLERGYGAVPVVDEAGHPRGIVTKTDVLRARGRERVTAGEVMSTTLVTLPEEAPVSRAAAVMSFEGIQRIPVLDASGTVVGILSAVDVLRALGRAAGYRIPDRR